ncbi:hypothetical protein HG535_0F05040 [Zygotorulaspora mrakii]|uniref:Suppressor of forked domain-containing protein n=1 Tax=Zygotorulaspora mrakii TaxID=42260 RepID=A0A7H9B8D8_ZYGMR|nr:uncharacterized protein HG535_0F05040 [Zygotorulaspora mrakii]QLG73992.1 hypothetical protein HG535_0F05040 [Zygotorulaspora mrakii]
MDKFTGIISDEKFSKISLAVAQYPKSLVHWEELLNYLISNSLPLNRSLDHRLYELIETTYDSMLSHFPYTENYYIDHALFQYKLGKVSKMHAVYQQGLKVFSYRSLHLWISYLKLCNEVVTSNKLLFQKYETAEKYIGLHYFSGEFWDLYLQQIQERCQRKERYFIILRKVLEIPLHSFSRFYAAWLRHIEEVQDVSQLNSFSSNEDLMKKLKIDVTYRGRKGPYLIECKKLLKKFTKELYMVVQYQVLEIYSLFESKLKTHYYSGPATLLPAVEVEIWDKYLDYTMSQRLDSLTHLNFQRALLPFAHYDIFWLKYANWLIDYSDDIASARNILIKGLSMSSKKNAIAKLLYATLCRLNDYDFLALIFEQHEDAHGDHIENVDDFEVFWDYVQFQTFCSSVTKSRYSKSELHSFMTPNVLDVILKRLSLQESKIDQLLLLSSILQLQTKSNTTFIEEKIFKHIIRSNWEFFLQNGQFWSLYSRLTFFNSSLSYLEKRRHIVKNIWLQGKRYNIKNLEPLREFCQSYLPEDIDALEEIFET